MESCASTSKHALTCDIYLAAYLQSLNNNLIKVMQNQRRRVSFLFEGDEVDALRLSYRSGPVTIDLRLFRDNLIQLRRMMAAKQRSNPCPVSNRASPLNSSTV